MRNKMTGNINRDTLEFYLLAPCTYVLPFVLLMHTHTYTRLILGPSTAFSMTLSVRSL